MRSDRNGGRSHWHHWGRGNRGSLSRRFSNALIRNGTIAQLALITEAIEADRQGTLARISTILPNGANIFSSAIKIAKTAEASAAQWEASRGGRRGGIGGRGQLRLCHIFPARSSCHHLWDRCNSHIGKISRSFASQCGRNSNQRK